jgi:hypothetical protein
MMTGERVHAGEVMWEALSPEARLEWSMAQAAQDAAVQGVMGMFYRCKFSDEAAQVIKDHLEEFILTIYEVPRERSQEVFDEAETLIVERMEADGEA